MFVYLEYPELDGSLPGNYYRFISKSIFYTNILFLDTCIIEHDDVNDLRNFKLVVRPSKQLNTNILKTVKLELYSIAEGYWKNGAFVFDIKIPTEYNMRPPACTCLTKLWHPNITEDGKICLR